MKKYNLVLVIAGVLFALLLLAGTASTILAGGKSTTFSNVYEFNPFPVHGEQVEGATATLRTDEKGARVKLNTGGLTPGDAVTLWWIIFNNPENCEGYPDSACTLNDLLGNPAGVGSEVTYADGNFVNQNGKIFFDGYLAKGETPILGWFGNGFTNPEGAEIHVVVHSHGQVIDGLASEMISTFRAGCADDDFINESHPAYGNGTPGPNQCVDLQFAVFQQD